MRAQASPVSASLPRVAAAQLVALARQAGFHEARWIDRAGLPASLAEHAPLAALGEGGFLMTALSCHRREPPDLSAPGDPHALVAPFARRDYYRDAVARLKEVVRAVCPSAGVDRRRARIFCNSRLPEKPLAVAAGLGFMGKNTLMIIPGLGSLFVIAGVFLPVRTAGEPPAPQAAGAPAVGAGCGACRACLEACPVGALGETGSLDASRCLQALAARAEAFSSATRAAWGKRLYGCQCCQDVCPYNASLRVEGETSRGEVGPSLSIRRLLRLGASGLKELLRPTPMGMSWIDPRALLRNALVAAGSSGDAAVLPHLEPYRDQTDGLLREAARWSAGRLESGSAGGDP